MGCGGALLTFGREDVVDNVEGAHKELLKYWSRVSGNRWLIAKMFGVLVCSMPRSPIDAC
jgi:hypothetical protein